MHAFLTFAGITCRRSQSRQGIPHLQRYLIWDVDCLRTWMSPVVLYFNQPTDIACNTNDVDRLGAICDTLKLVTIKGPVIVLAGLATDRKAKPKRSLRNFRHEPDSAPDMN